MQLIFKTTQNDILDILGDILRETMTNNITPDHCEFYSIIADELSDDIANKHILSLCIRYLKYDGDDFLGIRGYT